MSDSLDRDAATALEATPAVLPFLPALLADIWALGSSPDTAVDLLRRLDLPPQTTRVLDLGCGKGAVAITLARELGFRVTGIDALPAFVEEARRRAADAGVASLCEFQQGDLRDALDRSEQVDVAIYAAVGPILGDQERTVEQLRRVVRPGGYILIDDVFLVDPTSAPPPGYEGYAGHDETIRHLTAHGDMLVQEVISTVPETEAENERNTALIRNRAVALARQQPRHAELFFEFVERQERESYVLETAVASAVWLLRRS
jgi:ubiquinone/menaquinone biosynthesis C-methylase UbiE